MAKGAPASPHPTAPRLAHIRYRARIMALMGGAIALGLLPNELLLGNTKESPLLVVFRLGIAAFLSFGAFALSRSPPTRFHVLGGTLGVFLLFLAGFFLFPLGLFDRLPPGFATAYAMTPLAILALAGIFPFLISEGALLVGVVVGFFISAVAGQLLPPETVIAQVAWATALLAAVVLWMQKITLRSLEHADLLGRTDPLTGTYNRRGLEEAGSRVGLSRQNFALLLLDVDNFKEINDTYGHACGDSLLQILASTLLENTRGEDTVARIGGDELVVLTVQERVQDGRAFAERIQDLLRRNRPVCNGQEVPLSLSVGLALRGKGEAFESVLQRADAALYAAKEAGGDRVAAAGRPEGQERALELG